MNGQRDYLGADDKINILDPLTMKHIDDDLRRQGLGIQDRQLIIQGLKRKSAGGVTRREIKELTKEFMNKSEKGPAQISREEARKAEDTILGRRSERPMLH